MSKIPELPDKWVREIASAAPVPFVGRQVLRDRFDAVHLLFPLAVRHSQENTEYVHLLRVWTRRTVTAIRFFRDFLPRQLARKSIKRLNQIRRVANSARDCDVLILQLQKSIEKYHEDRGTSHSSSGSTRAPNQAERADRDWLKSTIHERANCQMQIRKLYDKLTRNDLLATILFDLLESCCDLTRAPRRHFEVPFELWATRELLSVVEDFLKSFPASGASLSELHRFRIKGKYLRYTLELVAFVLPMDMTVEVYQELSRMQDRLGKLNDQATTCEKLKTKRKHAKKKSERRKWRKLKKKSKRELRESRLQIHKKLDPRSFLEFRKRLKMLVRQRVSNLSSNETESV